MNNNFKLELSKNLKNLNQYFPELKRPVLRIIIQICVLYLEKKSCSEDVQKSIEKLSNLEEITEHFHEILTGIFLIMETYLRSKEFVKDIELYETLKDILKLENECVDDICNVLLHHRDSLALNLYEIKTFRTSPKKIVWRINISLMDSKITRLSHPSIIFHFYHDGCYRSFEVSLSIFHKLRYNIANMLKEMQTLEGKQLMKK